MFCTGIAVSSLFAAFYLYAISIHSAALAVAMSLIGWGVIFQGHNAIFPSFFPELFQTRVRVSAMAIAQNTGVVITAFLPMIFAALAPPGSANIPLTIGTLAVAIGFIAAFASWSAREPYRIRLEDLGKPDAVPVGQAEYQRIMAQDPFRPVRRRHRNIRDLQRSHGDGIHTSIQGQPTNERITTPPAPPAPACPAH